MKTLMKISMCLVLGLFISLSATAQVPATDSDAGTLTLNVHPYLYMDVLNGNGTLDNTFTFEYDHNNTGNNVFLNRGQVKVYSNIAWTLEVSTSANYFQFGGADSTIPVESVECSIDNQANLPAGYVALGTTNTRSAMGYKYWNLFWKFDPAVVTNPVLQALLPGDYTVPVDYNLTTP